MAPVGRGTGGHLGLPPVRPDLAALTGYAPKVDLERGLERFAAWYRGFYG